jgi:hypothetical protein
VKFVEKFAVAVELTVFAEKFVAVELSVSAVMSAVAVGWFAGFVKSALWVDWQFQRF